MYNLVVIGAGSGGLVSAYIAAAVKAKVALVEKHKMGGDCLNYGCVPSKALIRTSRFLADVKRAHDFGVKHAAAEFDFAQVMARVQQKIQAIAPHDSVERYTSLGVECVNGEAKIIDKHTVEVGGRTLKTRNIILALGASPSVPKIPGLEGLAYKTSETIWQLRQKPRKMLVVGGGAIGCELAQAFQRLGCAVTLVESLPTIMAREDADVSQAVTTKLRAEGVEILSHTAMRSVQAAAQGSESGEATLECDGRTHRVGFDVMLVAVGRRANTDGVDWSRLGIELNQDRTFKVDRFLRVNGDNIFACGDCVGPYQFTHAASHQAWYCAVNALFRPFKKFAVDYRVLPRVTFTDPEVARVGLSEGEARAAGIAHEVTRYGLDDLDRAICDGDDHGFVKVLSVPGRDKILGATIVGTHAGELLTEMTAAMKFGRGLGSVLGTIHPYPTFGEANKYVAGVWKKNHAPTWALKLLVWFHRLRRS